MCIDDYIQEGAGCSQKCVYHDDYIQEGAGCSQKCMYHDDYIQEGVLGANRNVCIMMCYIQEMCVS